jgi:predicted alpha/beta-fold hydrolase
MHPVRERIETPDGDFLDLDWHRTPDCRGKLAVVSHGLEGNSRKKYPLGMARVLNRAGWDVICFNFRCCSGEPNRKLRFYHSGVTDDLHTVLTHGLASGHYESAGLVGFSMGGNQTLKYLGEAPGKVPGQLRGAVVFSVPCQLGDAVEVMSKVQNRPYMRYFMNGLHQKIRVKAAMFPGKIDTEGLEKIMTFDEFDDRYTAPLHGFDNAADYYTRSSAARFLHYVQVPTLIVQALDDPFLSASCYPVEAARENQDLFLEVPDYGGHVGFMGSWRESDYWSEKRALEFLESVL